MSDEGTTRTTGESNYTPKSPEDGDSPSAIVEGFINAMTAIPIRTDVAKEFLSSDARPAWQPEQADHHLREPLASPRAASAW